MFKYIIVLLAAMPLTATAETYITLGGWSVHGKKDFKSCDDLFTYSSKRSSSEVIRPAQTWKSTKSGKKCNYDKYNGSHKAVIVDRKGLTIGTYVNSYGFRTNLAGYKKRWKSFSLGAYYGTGYTGKNWEDGCKLKLAKECLLISASYSFRPLKVSFLGDAMALAFEFNL